jgi:hypothetical protein
MLDDSSFTPKGTLRRVPVPPIYPYRLFRLHAARWVQWTRTVATAPTRRTCDLSRSSHTKRHRPRSLPRVHTRHPCLKQRQKVPMAVVTRVRTTSRRCALRGVFAAEMIVGMMEMMGRPMENGKRMKMALEIYAWRVRLLTRDRAVTFLLSRVPRRALHHYKYSRTSSLLSFPDLAHPYIPIPSPTVNNTSVFSPCLTQSNFPYLFHSFPSAFPSFLSFLLHYTACVHDVHILNTLNIRWQKLGSLSSPLYTYEYIQLQLDLSSEDMLSQQITFGKRTNCH